MRLIAAVLLAFIWLWAAPHVAAQDAGNEPPAKVIIDKSKLLGRPKNPDGTLVVTGFTENPVQWMREKQQRFYSTMNANLRQLKAKSSATAAWTLFVMSFFYGVFHAAGPGHGKAVISGWLLATENELRRGILIAFMSALIQALTAIVIVSALLLFVSGAARMARDATDVLESTSYALIAAMGAYLVWMSWKSKSKPLVSHQVQATVKPAAGVSFELASHPKAITNDHVHDEHCGHLHAPAAAEVRGDWSWQRAFAMAFAVGIRPCSGAIIVLFFSYPLGLYAAGVASVLAMGVGVFLTIALIAILTVYAKSWALTLAGADNPWTSLAVTWGKVAVGVAIAAFGALLFFGSLGTTNLAL